MRSVIKVGILSALAALVVALAWSWGWHWLTTGRFEEATDNAYVRTEITSVAAKVTGYVLKVSVADNATVEAGDVLFQIDDKDYKARLAQAEANIASARAALLNLEAEARLQKAVIAQGEAQLRSAIATQTLAMQNFDRNQSLVRTSTVSQAKFEESEAGIAQAEASVSAAKAAIQAQQRKLDVLAAQEDAARAALSQAEAARTLAQIDLDNTTVRAPVNGVVGNRQIRVGRLVNTGAPVLDIVPVHNVWIVANYKETQLEDIRVGQPVRVSVDGYPHAEVLGVVDSLAPGSGAAFSLIPADNATGNFVRVVQRVPVKITLTEIPSHVHLVPGLSARVAIKTSGGEGAL
ncbi:HlyD family secretion protein [Agrobacterium sp. B1(2019)]|uniref:HlyD family secretion protein n=1 Tax=Agrobacterium sp. B1(2019) TaxID=2607032 RepID=UPI0011EFB700|nr:HlyD family secretion protein [Agrobacterium sp. B1(2019)]TZG36519.1 HlyD family secretion protein [Agrobacterium sp. B1(2019)]